MYLPLLISVGRPISFVIRSYHRLLALGPVIYERLLNEAEKDFGPESLIMNWKAQAQLGENFQEPI